jgi:hypothetical protein
VAGVAFCSPAQVLAGLPVDQRAALLAAQAEGAMTLDGVDEVSQPGRAGRTGLDCFRTCAHQIPGTNEADSHQQQRTGERQDAACATSLHLCTQSTHNDMPAREGAYYFATLTWSVTCCAVLWLFPSVDGAGP